MIFAFAFTVFIGLCAVALIGLEDSHYKVTRLLEDLDEHATLQPTQQTTQHTTQQVVAPMVKGHQTVDAFGELAFTRSLLALGKVDLLMPCDSPAPVPGESSSLVSVRLDQSKNRVQAL
jgi:hypothetical protein